ncbi:hypothetical protein B0T25DRAFT_533040 [Lasiosphaeria hispida]|uniref:Lipid droplet-associated hydrolase n=1 Tax=Lasiosphaeria hispida TaxID=260671 RepID=A0AAJ0MHN4_9PEZI|nr:hypothetical protein B0T25DRAFT_533040 [Lasiosphaeria hispida]
MAGGTTQGGAPGARDPKVPSLEFPSADNEAKPQKCLVFFIPGNPGLVGYYEAFLGTLRELLDGAERRTASRFSFHIYAQNLLGFDAGDHDPFGNPPHSRPPFTLEEQVCHFYDRLLERSTIPLSGGGTRPAYDKVIIMGHSVGAYISIEVFHRHHLELKAAMERQDLTNNTQTPAASVSLKAGIMLFPAVSHLAKSTSGQKLEMIRTTPFLDSYAHYIAKLFIDLWPYLMLVVFIRLVMGFPAHVAGTTARFLKSRDGIWQAIHLAKDELKHITEEKWSEDLWEIADVDGSEGAADKFFFYFGEKDHWVADECRNEFIERRKGHAKGRTTVVVDEDKIPHAFCIHHSEQVAEKVMVWVDEIAKT